MMKRGIVSLILVLVASTAVWAFDDGQVITLQQGDDNNFVFMGPQHGSYMGVRTEDVTKDRLDALKMKEETGAEVMAVDQDAPAGKAGIKEHDVIVSVNGQKIESEEQLRRIVREIPPGRQITVGLLRLGQPVSVTVTLADRKVVMSSRIRMDHDMAMTPMAPMPPMPPMANMDIDVPNFTVMVQNTSRTGLVVENLTPQLAEFFGARGGRGGVLIRSVEKGSIAEAAGFKAGDVIVGVNKDPVSDLGDWRRAVRNNSGATPFKILRDKREQQVTLKLPEHKHSELRKGDFENFDVDVNMDGFDPAVFQKDFTKKIDTKQWKDYQKKMEKFSKDMEKQYKFEYTFDEQ
jgi:membrane-associated protease RseP (regulator of RpoE activity)